MNGRSFEYHYPVLCAEILEFASPLEGIVSPLIVDCTLGDGGHTISLFRRFPTARLISFDRDPEMLERAIGRIRSEPLPLFLDAERFDEPGIYPCRLPFSDGGPFLERHALQADFILLDAGVSQFHFLAAGRGFSYSDEKLDMRLDPNLPETAADLIARSSAEELADLFATYGEERYSRRIAAAVKGYPKIDSAAQLADVVMRALPGTEKKKGKIHPATRVFQALRIAVNHETEELEGALNRLPAHLADGGRLAVISFHSLEDRIVKRAFQAIAAKRQRTNKYRHLTPRGDEEQEEQSPFFLVTRSPIIPSEKEIGENPPSRSAKLRVLERMNRK